MTASATAVRGGYATSAAAAVATLFVFAPRTDAIRFVAVTGPVVVVLLVIAALGALASRTGRPALFAAVAGVALAASLLQLAQFGRDPNWLGGNGSTASFLGALALAFGGLWYAARNGARDSAHVSRTRRADRSG
ncbi:Rv1678 family membrane protein [Blastococcus saxobsidens]|uniref:Uncharacterized protein n=1 Tax=Blastococcus saxobsidens TaxID=138336 RepID=A0A4Q7Y5H4_9ACTN|nr:hypothetical protein [Blastococcus saxobsidens]RZU31139.1 hypothetical protein BKA19_0787 [Blastococcus saxobsidens]